MVREAGWAALAEALPQLSCLANMNCYGNAGMGCAGAAALAGALPHARRLVQVSLGGCGIKIEGALALAEALPECLALKQLVLGGNEIGEDGKREVLRVARAAGVNVNV